MRIFIYFLLVFACFGFLSNPYLNTAGTDSSIFLYVARMLNNGLVPYLHVFDHKGPLIYFIDALGWLISPTSFLGIFILDSFIFLLAMYLTYKLARRYVSADIAISVIFPISAIYHLLACGGNMPEMYIIVFALISYLICIQENAWSMLDCIVMGLCVGAIFMLKLNMITVACPIGLCWLWRQNKTKALIGLIIGFMLVFAPIMLYFWVNDALYSFWEVYIVYNKIYSGSLNLLPEINRGFFIVAFIFFVAVYQYFFYDGSKKLKSIIQLNLMYFFIAWAMVILSGGTFRYYGPILPACILPLSLLYCKLNKLLRHIATTVAVSILIIAIMQRNLCHNNDDKILAMNELKSKITDFNSVTVMGCDCLVYLYLNAQTPTRFPFQGTISVASSAYRDCMLNDIKCGKSEYIIVPAGTFDKNALLDMSWASKSIPMYYHAASKTGIYTLYKRNKR